MCLPTCSHVVSENLSRRGFLAGSVSAGAMALSSSLSTRNASADDATVVAARTFPGFSRVVDLTHALTPTFPTFSGLDQFRMEQSSTLAKDGYCSHRWNLSEHTGTHIDAPLHFGDGKLSAGQIPVEQLVLPLCVVDTTAAVLRDPDARLGIKDLEQWESTHGRIPSEAAIAMSSGWDQHVNTPRFRNADNAGVMHFPGFDLDAVTFLMTERGARALIVDTLSLDFGPSTDFEVHTTWLPTNRWAAECVANLGKLPAKGATLVAGCPKVPGASGGPARLMALI